MREERMAIGTDLGDGWKAYENAEGELGVDGMMFEIQLD